ncbi:arylsulfatase-like [Antedon mediterranea]|uniref:arylsulfatase-like n=1 Tax=Antedon mediterranea TaxID=105859 RepID=UPI003AF73772
MLYLDVHFFSNLLFLSFFILEIQSSDLIDKPNVILILADDLGFGDLSSYGHPTQEVGAIDQLAAEGIRFTQWYSPSSLCSPSRAAMLTGRLPVRLGVYGDLQVFLHGSQNGLPKEEVTIPEALKRHGYKTGMTGKWHLGINEFEANDGRHLPVHHGFDFVGYNLPFTNHWLCDDTGIHRTYSTPSLCFLYYNTTIVQQPIKLQELTSSLVLDAKAFIHENKDDPFFLYFSLNNVHDAMFAGNKFKGKSKRGIYGDCVNDMHWAVGEVIDTLKQLRLEKKTLVLFLSDHGPHTELGNEGGITGPFRGNKGTSWEGGYRVPAIAWWPGMIKPGQTSNAVISSLDLYPTIINIINGNISNNLLYDGVNVKNAILENADIGIRMLFYYCDDRLTAVRYGSYKVHLYTFGEYDASVYNVGGPKHGIPQNNYYHCLDCYDDCVKGHNPPIMFNIDIDPSELYPLDINTHADVLEKVFEELQKHKETLIVKPALLDTWIKSLVPCCNPPYCICDKTNQNLQSCHLRQ